MEDKYVVQNKTGTVFRMPKLGLTFAKDQTMDFCKSLCKSTAEIKRDPSIILELTYNNLEVIEEYDSSQKAEEIGGQLESVLALLQAGALPPAQAPIAQQTPQASFDMEGLAEMLDKKISSLPTFQHAEEVKKKDDEEEQMKLAALEQLVSQDKKVDKSFEKFGKERKVENESDDFSDMLDF